MNIPIGLSQLNIIKKAFTFICLGLVLLDPVSSAALANDQKRVIDSGAYYFNIADDNTSRGGNCSLPGNDNQEKVWNYLISKPGYTPEIAAGIIGNMIVESGVLPMRLQGRPAAEEYSSQDVESRTGIGWGLVQWTNPGKMITPSRAEGKTYEEINTVETQVEFLWRQLEGEAPDSNEKAAGDHLKQQTTVADAARSFMVRYERPRDQSEAKIQDRIGYAEDVYARLSSLSVGSDACVGNGDWTWPMEPVGTITSCYGPRSSPGGGVGSTNHKGLDVAAGGTGKLLAADSGTVSYIRATDQGGYGIHLIIDHGNGYKTLYAHAQRLYKNLGDGVAAGEHIADEGTTGSSTGNHLHFEIRLNDNQINPLDEMTIPSDVNNRANCTGRVN